MLQSLYGIRLARHLVEPSIKAVDNILIEPDGKRVIAVGERSFDDQTTASRSTMYQNSIMVSIVEDGATPNIEPKKLVPWLHSNQKDEQPTDSLVSSDSPADSNGIIGPEKSKNDIDSLLVTEFEEVKPEMSLTESTQETAYEPAGMESDDDEVILVAGKKYYLDEITPELIVEVYIDIFRFILSSLVWRKAKKIMNVEKIKKLQQNAAQVRTGGKGTARRKKKVVHKTAATDDKKLQSNLKKLSVTNIPGIEEVNMIKDDGTVIHFNNPKVQASVPANTFSVTGSAENKQITEMLPGILNQLGAESLTHLKKLANNVTSQFKSNDDDDVPDLVGDFDEASKNESKVGDCKHEHEHEHGQNFHHEGGEMEAKLAA
ncbi:unnamed protein product [Acanthocheilonema viteae]|nr:unnamed protein product [Acanthocheilonema viteae]